MRAIERLGHEVAAVDTSKPWADASWIMRQLQRRAQLGPVIDAINKKILSAAEHFQPHLIWAEKQEFLRPETIQKLQAKGAKIIHFTPDPYFYLSWKRTRLMDEAINAFDALLYCKSYEFKNYAATGKPVVYFPLGYCDEIHRPNRSGETDWTCDVGFLGGWEPRREEMLRKVALDNTNLKIWGTGWDFLTDGKWTIRRHIVLSQLAGDDNFRIHSDPILTNALYGTEVYADDYARALSEARIGLGFLRTVCPDQHTTRTFEIPACGSMLLADRTEEHQEFFEEGKEAEFFSSTDEMLDKMRFYLSNELERNRIAQRGLERCRASEYAYIHRVSNALSELKQLFSLPS